jgi:hypothetical protein
MQKRLDTMMTLKHFVRMAWNLDEGEYERWREHRLSASEWPVIKEDALAACIAAALMRQALPDARAAQVAGEWVMQQKDPAKRAPMFAINLKTGSWVSYTDRHLSPHQLFTGGGNRGWADEIYPPTSTAADIRTIDAEAIVKAVAAQLKAVFGEDAPGVSC